MGREGKSPPEPLRNCRVKVFIDYQSSSAPVTFRRSCRAAELEYEHKENTRRTGGAAGESQYRAYLNVSSLEEELWAQIRAGTWKGREGKGCGWARLELWAVPAKNQSTSRMGREQTAGWKLHLTISSEWLIGEVAWLLGRESLWLWLVGDLIHVNSVIRQCWWQG